MLVTLKAGSGVVLGTFTRVEEAQRFAAARDARMGVEGRTVWFQDASGWRGAVEGTGGAEVRYRLEVEGS